MGIVMEWCQNGDLFDAIGNHALAIKADATAPRALPFHPLRAAQVRRHLEQVDGERLVEAREDGRGTQHVGHQRATARTALDEPHARADGEL